MAPSSADPSSAPGAEPAPLDAAAALREIQRVTRRVRASLWREVLQWLWTAAYFPIFLLVQHLHLEQSKGLVIAAIVVGVSLAVVHWRTAAFSRGATRRDKVTRWTGVLLGCGAVVVLDQAPPGLSLWVVIIAIVPGVPALVAAASVLRR
ncbi:hypothetical protein ABZ783_03165 [Micromonospora sp. NPDC047738]|uniref:hypothetical protein n=1 Tax=Micromonospora sp. NPDC047738 TaxID=3155741 RepID=UPI003408A464